MAIPLYCTKKHLADSISPVESYDPRITAVKLLTSTGPLLLLCVYMPTDTGDADCLDDYLETCSRVHAMCADCDTVQTNCR